MAKGKLPYMFIVHTHNPKEGAHTNQKDWSKKNEWAVTETAEFRDNIPDDLLLKSDVIIDILNGKIVKNRLENVDNQQLIEHYMGKYQDKVVEAVRVFFQQNPDYWERMVKSAEEIAKQLETQPETQPETSVSESVSEQV